MVKKYIVLDDPELSANQLAKYLTTVSHTAKEGILRAAKYISRETKSRKIRYSVARDSIVLYLKDRSYVNISSAKSIFQKTLNFEEEGKESPSTFALSDASLSMAALDAFSASIQTLPLSGSNFEPGDKRPPKIDIEGVTISVRPDVIITKVKSPGNVLVGGGLLYFAVKSQNENDEDGEEEGISKDLCATSATLVYLYVEKYLTDLGTPTRGLCYSFDVFGKKAHPAPTSFKARMANMHAACRVIAASWASVGPPNNWPSHLEEHK